MIGKLIFTIVAALPWRLIAKELVAYFAKLAKSSESPVDDSFVMIVAKLLDVEYES